MSIQLKVIQYKWMLHLKDGNSLNLHLELPKKCALSRQQGNDSGENKILVKAQQWPLSYTIAGNN